MPGAAGVNKRLKDWADRQVAASLALGQTWAGKLEGQMKDNAPWTDRTSNARNGLFATARFESDHIRIIMAHSVEYGKYLELARDGRYAIIRPTRNQNAKQVKQSFQDLWGR